MSGEYLGTIVALTLLPNELPDQVEGGQHVTLLYFGEDPLTRSQHEELLNIVADIAERYKTLDNLKVEEVSYFGVDGDAAVVELDSTPASEAVNIRQEIINALTPELYQIFDDAQTFPDYNPHVTMGYISEGFDVNLIPEVLPEYLVVDSLSVWAGDNRVNFSVGDILAHYGIIRKSGRYPWGSGANPNQRSRDFMGMVEALEAKGLSEKDIAKGMSLNTRELRQHKAMAKVQIRKANEAQALKLKDKGYSNVAIGERMGINESSVRALLNPTLRERRSLVENTVEMLKSEMADGSYLDIGKGSELHLNGVSATTLKNAVSWLEDEGYQKQYLNVRQLTTGKDTSLLVLTPGDLSYSELLKNQDKVKNIGMSTVDKGKSWQAPEPPKSINSDRVTVKYGSEGGADMDGILEIRPGAKDLDLGNSRYAQVRVAVDNTHYLKGVAIYSDTLPDGVDIRFNTNKEYTGNKLDVMKEMSDDPSNPWGAVIKVDGQRGVLNVINEEGDWYNWSRSISSQMLSKQKPSLAKQQLDLTYDIKRAEFDEIMSLTNPTVKEHLLGKFADGVDSSAVYLKAKGLPGTQNHVILPITSMKPGEIYAPQYKDGERVVLIRHPHGGIFEIPELTVNNKQRDAKKIIGTSIDAVGINPKVAEQLSGADFDGDTVLVIPNRPGPGKIRSERPLKELDGFNPQVQYKGGPNTQLMRNTQTEMGMISNLITDMTIQGAVNSEIARAVKHSMVVIDAEKHKLDYKQSYLDNNIIELKRKYQGGARAGAETLISRASSEARVDKRKGRSAAEGGPIDKETGKLMFTPTGEEYVNAQGKTIRRTEKSTRMAETDDARTLMSKDGTGTLIESVYANHANKLKALANEARKEMVNTPKLEYSPSAFKTYSSEVQSLTAKLNVAKKNAPLERQAQLLANAAVKQKRLDNPGLTKDDLKKEERKSLALYRARTGAGKQSIEITPPEWEAIQAGAISNNRLKGILQNSNLDEIKKLATPRTQVGMSAALVARAKAMATSGYTQAEIASALGVSASSINTAING